jgi:hypothetical protein
LSDLPARKIERTGNDDRDGSAIAIPFHGHVLYAAGRQRLLEREAGCDWIARRALPITRAAVEFGRVNSEQTDALAAAANRVAIDHARLRTSRPGGSSVGLDGGRCERRERLSWNECRDHER